MAVAEVSTLREAIQQEVLEPEEVVSPALEESLSPHQEHSIDPKGLVHLVLLVLVLVLAWPTILRPSEEAESSTWVVPRTPRIPHSKEEVLHGTLVESWTFVSEKSSDRCVA